MVDLVLERAQETDVAFVSMREVALPGGPTGRGCPSVRVRNALSGDGALFTGSAAVDDRGSCGSRRHCRERRGLFAMVAVRQASAGPLDSVQPATTKVGSSGW